MIVMVRTTIIIIIIIIEVKRKKTKEERKKLTLYQCFLTLPSVLFGNVLAISLQDLPASRICFNRCSSCGVQGVFVRDFLFGGDVTPSAPVPSPPFPPDDAAAAAAAALETRDRFRIGAWDTAPPRGASTCVCSTTGGTPVILWSRGTAPGGGFCSNLAPWPFPALRASIDTREPSPLVRTPACPWRAG